MTTWFYDVEGRPTNKVYADQSVETYSYESNTSQLLQVIDAKSQSVTYGYNTDNTIANVAYSSPNNNAPLGVGFTYDRYYRRVVSMQDGVTGTTSYTYGKAGSLGGNQLASVQVAGPLASYVLAYQYDEWRRVVNRTVDGSDAVTWAFDSLGRLNMVTNPLGVFNYGYDGATSRVTSITPSVSAAPVVQLAYNDSTNGDRRLKQIQNTSDSTLLSQFNYIYDPRGDIQQWAQQNPAQSTTINLQYDPAGQLYAATYINPSNGALTNQQAYGYDQAGNRISYQSDSNLSNATYNQLNQLTGQSAGGNGLHFTGTVDQLSTVTVNGQTAQVDKYGNFDGMISVKPGVNQINVIASNSAGSRENTYQITVNGALTSLSGVAYDPNGDMTADGTGVTYEYDSLNRLTAVNESATARSEFAYDGLNRRVQIIERAGKGGAISSTENFVYDGLVLIQNRNASNSAQQSFFSQGEQWIGGNTAGNYYYTKDHLGSVREFVDATGAVRARYSYDLWGNRTKLAGNLDSNFGFTGYWYHTASNLYLSPTRPYSSALGRFTSRDSIAEQGGMNLYRYVNNNPVISVDALGLCPPIVPFTHNYQPVNGPWNGYDTAFLVGLGLAPIAGMELTGVGLFGMGGAAATTATFSVPYIGLVYEGDVVSVSLANTSHEFLAQQAGLFVTQGQLVPGAEAFTALVQGSSIEVTGSINFNATLSPEAYDAVIQYFESLR